MSVKHLTELVEKVMENNRDISLRLAGMKMDQLGPCHAENSSSATETILKDDVSAKSRLLMEERAETPRYSLERASVFGFTFDRDLKASRVYSRVFYRASVNSLTSSGVRSIGWSILSCISLGAVSNISVFALPVNGLELYNWQQYHDRVLGSKHSKPSGITLSLHQAARYDHGTLIDYLFANDADINARAADGSTALHQAAKNGSETALRSLLRHGAEVNVQHSTLHISSPLHWACTKGHEAVTQVLLENGAEVDARDNWLRTPLLSAAWGGHVACAKALLTHGASAIVCDRDGCTALHMAASNGHVDMQALLLKGGADIEARVSSARLSIEYSSLDKHLENATPLILAVAESRVDNVADLVKYGCNISAKTASGWTALHFVAFATTKEPTAILPILLEAGANTEARNLEGNTPLHLVAASWQSVETVSILLKAGADIEARNKAGNTPLQRAVKSEEYEKAKYLVQEGASVTAIAPNGRDTQEYAKHLLCSEELARRLKKVFDEHGLLPRGTTPPIREAFIELFEQFSLSRQQGRYVSIRPSTSLRLNAVT